MPSTTFLHPIVLRVIVIGLTLSLTGVAAPAETVTVYRDSFGIPHIYADTAEAGLWASGWAMAQDGLERTLENFLRGMGRFSQAFGPGDGDANVRADLESLMWDHYGVSRRRYPELPAELRLHIEAFVAGINAFMQENPEAVPGWWTHGPVDRFMPVAFSRQFIWGWPAGQAASDLRAVGLEPNYDTDIRASNEMAISPERTSFGAAALVIDPHLSWYGRFRYWELRLHAGDIHISGFATAGFPYVNLGHNNDVAWAHTTGGPDTADVYRLELDAGRRRYRYDQGWRDLDSRTVMLPVAGESVAREVTFHSSHHGPIVATETVDGTPWAYAAALAYADEIGYLESKYHFMKAKSYRDVIAALEVRQIMPQNVMVADTEGNIYYQRTGRTPIRAAGLDPSRPLDGTTSSTEWRGIHPTADLIQLLNPTQGYMQNCNITPDVMLVDSPMTANRYPPYIFNQPPLTTHQRASRATQLLAENDTLTSGELLEIAVDRKVFQYGRWIAQLERAAQQAPELSSDARSAVEELRAWDGRADRDSAAALKYYSWRSELRRALGRDGNRTLAARIDDFMAPFRPAQPNASLSADEQAQLVAALEAGMVRQRERQGHLDGVYGDVFRAGRLDYDDSVHFPVGGGSLRDEGMATVRAIGFGPELDDGTRRGQSGQTSTAVVVMTRPIQSWTQAPLGQSDHEDSPHFRDQARDLLGPGRFKPSWFQLEDLLDGHVESKTVLEYPGR